MISKINLTFLNILLLIFILICMFFLSFTEEYRYQTYIEGCTSDTCAICLEELTPETIVHPCTQSESHCFHRDCITNWVKAGGIDCPICRSPLKSEFLPQTKKDEVEVENEEEVVEEEETNNKIMIPIPVPVPVPVLRNMCPFQRKIVLIRN